MPEADPLARGRALLARADWKAASDAFEAALALGPSAGALAGLGECAFWLGDVARAVELRQRAYVAFRKGGDDAAAAREALWLATEFTAALGNAAVGNGWLARAERLIEDIGDCAERGWLLLRRSRWAPEPAAAEALAQEAFALARAHGDRDLEIAAISQRGRVLLAMGQTDRGFACLDEAMAAATSGEVLRPDVVSDTCCDMIVACERTMAFERATQWCNVTDDYARRFNFLPLFAFCRVTYAGVLIALGRWSDAERELGQAIRSYQASFASKSFVALVKLAELRLLQGRDAEAEELLADQAQSPAAARALGMLHLARGDGAAAARGLERRLSSVGNDVLLAAPLLALLVEAHLAAGEIAQAAAAVARLEGIASATRCTAFVAAAAFASAQVRCKQEDGSAAATFERAIQAYVAADMPLHAARARLGLARCLAQADRRSAKEECRAAIAAFEELGARRDLDAAAELRRELGVGAKTGRRSTASLTNREREVLALLGLGLSNAKIGSRLFISPKTVEHHVSHILDKLGLETRAAAAAWAVKAAPPPKPGAK